MGAVETKYRISVPHGKLDRCIAEMEDALKAVNETPYHAVVGKNWLHHSESAAEYLEGFFAAASSEQDLRALYFEMNGFTINPDRWYFSGFGYQNPGNIWKLDWLSEWNCETDDGFLLEGFESVQEAFKLLFLDEAKPLRVSVAQELAEHLIAARYSQLIASAHQLAKGRCAELKNVRVLSAPHDWDVIHESV